MLGCQAQFAIGKLPPRAEAREDAVLGEDEEG